MDFINKFRVSMNDLTNPSDPEEKEFLMLKQAFENYEEGRLLSILNTEGIECKRYPGKHGKNQTTLHIVVQFGRVKMAEHLIRLGANVNAQDDLGRTPLYEALTNNLTMMKLLLRNGANIDISTKDGVLPLHLGLLYSPINEIVLLLNPELASENARIDDEYSKNLVELLLNREYKLNIPSSKYSTLLHFIIRNKDKESLIKVLSRNMQFDINALNFDRESLLHVAVRLGQKEIVEILLKCDLEVNVIGPLQHTPLHYAVKYKKFELIKPLLEHGADANAATTSGAKVLHLLWEIIKKEKRYTEINDDDIERFQLLLRNGFTLNSENDHDKLMIEEVTQGFVWKLLRIFMENGAKVELQTELLTHKLGTAMTEDDFETIDFILEKSLEINFVNKGKGSPIHLCIEIFPSFIRDRLKVLRHLVKCGVDINTTSNMGKTALHLATEKSLILEVQCLIELGADVNRQSKSGETPLLVGWNNYFPVHQYHHATNRLAILKLLLNNAADVNYGINTDHSNIPTLQQALLSESLKGIQLIIEERYRIRTLYTADPFQIGRRVVGFLLRKENRSINFNLHNTKYSTLLHFSAVHGDDETLNYALRKCTNFDINAFNISGRTLLHHVIENERESNIEILVENGADVHLPDVNGRTPCHYAVRSNNSRIVDYFLNHGVDINSPDFNRHTPLHYSMCYENLEIIKMLLNKDADVNVQSSVGTLPLHLCCGRNTLKELLSVDSTRNTGEEDPSHRVTPFDFTFNKSIMKLLIERGADVNAPGFRGRTLLSEACLGGALDIVAFLLENGADIELPGEGGKTPLLQACLGGHLEIVSLLLAKGADLHKVDEDSNNVLHLAVLASERYVAKLLLQKGIDVNSKNASGFTPLTYLCENNNNMVESKKFEMLELLVDYQADVNVKGSYNMTLVDFAVWSDELTIVEYLLDLNAHLTKQIFKHGEVNLSRGLKLALACIAIKRRKIRSFGQRYVKIFYKQCCDELFKSREMPVCNTSTITFFNFLTGNLRVLTPIWENDEMMEVFKSFEYKNKLPIFGDILEMRISRIEKLSIFMKETKSFLEKYSKKNLPNLVLDKIYSFLRYEDFRCLMRALSLYDTSPKCIDYD